VNPPRFFVPGASIRREGGDGPGAAFSFSAVIAGDEAHHAVNVLRLGAGDPVVLIDGSGDEFWGAVERLATGPGGPRVEVAGASIRRSPAEPPFEVLLVQGVPKGDKLEEIVEKGTEAGVTRFLPVYTERSVVRYAGDKAEKKRSRLERVAIGAAKQCRRGRAPAVLPFQDLEDAASGGLLDGLVWIAFWEGAAEPLRRVAERIRARGRSGPNGFALFIGPEGGFAEREARFLEGRGAHLASLGPRILRTETAGPIAAALLLYEFDDGGSGGIAP